MAGVGDYTKTSTNYPRHYPTAPREATRHLQPFISYLQEGFEVRLEGFSSVLDEGHVAVVGP